MILFDHKPLLKKDIDELKFNNHEKQLNTYSTFYKTFHKNIFREKEKFKDKNNNELHLISLLKSKIFTKGDKHIFNIQTNYNSFSPYVTKMIANAAKLAKYNNTKYISWGNLLSPQKSDESLNNSNLNLDTHINKKKSFFGLDCKIPLYLEENNTLNTNATNLKYLIKSPSSITNYNKGDDDSKINKEEYNIIREDNTLGDKIFNEIYLNKKENYNTEEINSFFGKYSIEKDLTNEEKENIKKILDSSKSRNNQFVPKDINDNQLNTKTFSLIKDYKNPYHSLEKIKFNYQMKESFKKIRNNLQFQKFQKQFNLICDLKISKNRMPNIKVLNKPSSINKMDLLKNKNVISYFKQHKNNILNKRKLRDINIIRNNEIDNINYEEYNKLSYEERIKKVQIEIWYLESNYHPESRIMSSICYDFDEKILYNYGGIGGKIFGDLWQCKFSENKIVWKKIFNFEKNKEYNSPLPRFGHTSHFYKKKIFLVGGEYKDWKRNLINEEILWIYDIERKEWNNLHKYEIKNRIYLDKRNSKNFKLFKLKKNFSDILLKIPLLISPEIDSSKKSKKKNINKPLFTYNKKEENKNINNLRPCTRRNHTSLLIGSHIFIYGGISQNKEILNDCWIYDLKLNKWGTIESIGTQPFALAHHCCCLAIEKDQLINDTFNIYHKPKNNRGTVDLLKMDGVFFFGGINNNKIPSNSLLHMSIGTKPAIFDIPNINGHPPKPRIDASMEYAENISMIIIYGGKNELEFSSYYGDMTLLDLRTMNWIQPLFMKEKPIKRAQHLSIIIGDELIIFGGNTGSELLNYDFTVVDLNLFNK